MHERFLIIRSYEGIETGTICANKDGKLFDFESKYATDSIFFGPNAVEISKTKSMYLMNYKKTLRLEVYKKELFEKIEILEINSLCVATIEGSLKWVQIISKDLVKDELRFVVKTSDNANHDIPASSIMEYIKDKEEFVNKKQAGGWFILPQYSETSPIDQLRDRPGNSPIQDKGLQLNKLKMNNETHPTTFRDILFGKRINIVQPNKNLTSHNISGKSPLKKIPNDSTDNNPSSHLCFGFRNQSSDRKLFIDNGWKIINPFNVESITDGRAVRKLMYLNTQSMRRLIYIKWKGLIDGNLCVGCELLNETEYGTNGTFACKRLFECDDKKGVLIQVDDLCDSCESNNHRQIVKFDGIMNRILGYCKNIDPDCICCVEWLTNTKSCPELIIGGRIKCKDQEARGICQWVGLVNGQEAFGVEMNTNIRGTNGQFSNIDLFSCPMGKGVLFVADDIVHDVENENLHFSIDKIVDIEKIFHLNPTLMANTNGILLGVPVTIEINSENYVGEVKWIGKINDDTCVGLDMEDRFENGMDGKIKDEFIFHCMPEHGLITPLTNVKLCEDAQNPQLIENLLINPNKYSKCEDILDQILFQERNVKIGELVFIIANNENGEMKMKGILRWCGMMNKMPVMAVELTQDHEYGTNGLFWRHQLFTCPDKRAIAVSCNKVYPYVLYKQKQIPTDDPIFKDIEIDSAIIYGLQMDDGIMNLYGNVKWIGVDENEQYLYGLEMDDRIPDGTDGQFNDQRLFQCRPGHGKLVSAERIDKETNLSRDEKELFNRYFLDLLKYSNNRDLERKIIKDILKMKDKRWINSLIEQTFKLDTHDYLLPLLMEQQNIETIKLILTRCDLTPIDNMIFLKLANLAIKMNDDDLFDLSVKPCQNKNECLENGETFLTNLFKENYPEETINRIITKDIFDLQVTNTHNESPFMLSCQMAMTSVVRTTIPKSLSSNQNHTAIGLVLEAESSPEAKLEIMQLIHNAAVTET